ncbi:MAG: hypothetical protein ACRBBW_13050 [Cellvibrionaceae bacterium]
MSKATIEVIMGRINAATEESQIAVFTCGESGKMIAVFANTKITQDRIARGDSNYVGSFHKHSDVKGIRSVLRKAMNASHQLSRIAAEETENGKAQSGELEADYLSNIKLIA